MPRTRGAQLPGFIGLRAGRVLPRKPPFSVCHQVSTMTASPFPTTSWYQRQTSGSIGSPRAGSWGQTPAGAVLAPLGPRRRATRVHEEQRGFSRHRDRLDHLPAVVLQEFVDEEVPPRDHGTLRRVLAGMPSPDQHPVDLDAALTGRSDRLVGLGLVVDQLAVA